MAYNSLSEFISMNGHGLYVWLSYGCGLLIIAYNLLSPRKTRRELIQRLKRQWEREDS